MDLNLQFSLSSYFIFIPDVMDMTIYLQKMVLELNGDPHCKQSLFLASTAFLNIHSVCAETMDGASPHMKILL